MVISAVLLAVAVAQASGVDCSKANTPQERAICASPALQASDEQMASAYRELLNAATSQMKDAVRNDQRAWLRGVARRCNTNPEQTEAELTKCLLADRESRTRDLHHRLVKDGGVTFVWNSTNFGGEKPGQGYLNASWPVALSDTPKWQAWNKAMESAMLRIASLENPPATEWKQIYSEGLDEEATGSLGPMTADLVTAEIESHWYGHGAAHPNENLLQFNWMLNERRQLRPEDVFRASSGWEATLFNRCDADLHRELDQADQHHDAWLGLGEVPKRLHSIVANPENWRLDASGLTITFQKYAVAPYCCTPQPVTVQWEELKPLLRADFAVPR